MQAHFAFSDFAAWGGGHNRCFQACVEACRDKRCVLDIGAHIGLVTLPMSRVLAPGGRVQAFEPARVNGEILRRHLELNGIDNVDLTDALVGAEDLESVRFFEQDEATGMNSVVVIRDHEAYHETAHAQVTLDRFLAERDLAPEVVKIDVEGAEIAVLEGARESLEKHKPLIFLSVHPKLIAQLGRRLEDLTGLIDALGYDCLDLDDRPVTRFETDEYRLVPRPRKA